MKIALLCPPRMGRRSGNAVTAQRYRSLFSSLGHSVRILDAYDGKPYDVLVALHAKKSAQGALAFARAHPQSRLIVVMTGTDLYRDIARSARAQRLLTCATSIVTLQRDGIRLLPQALRRKAIAIVQSALMPRMRMRRDADAQQPWRFLVVGHLRREKDSLRAAQALALLPRSLCATVLQIGSSLDASHTRRALAWQQREKRYRWVGERSALFVRQQMTRGDVLVIPSRMEGGANVVCEAIAAGLPVLASRISGNLGLLGDTYSGYFAVGNTMQCAALMRRFAEDASFRTRLRREIRALASLVKPKYERSAWEKLLR